MNRNFRKGPFFFAIVSVLALLPAAACKKDSGGSGAAASVMKQLPADSIAAGGLNIGGIADDSFVRAQLDKNMPPELKEFKEKCGIDIFSDVEQILVGFKDKDNVIAAAKVKFDQAKAEECVEEYGGTVEKDGDVSKITLKGDPQFVKWSDGVMLMSASKEALAGAGKGDGLSGNKDVMKYVEKANTGATIWSAGEIPEELKGQIPLSTPPEGFYFSMKATDELDIHAGVVFAEEKDAESLKTMAEQGMKQFEANPMLGSYVKKVKLEQDGAEVKVSIVLSEDDLKQLQGLAGMMGGGL